MLSLDFSYADLNLPETREKTRRASISGVQDKVQLSRIRGGFVVVESGGGLHPQACAPQHLRGTRRRHPGE